mmetsp:Transcript_38646/g.74096  ORF Transcript_38646/g.74096 Transcript_38646/m.74096 type:complete len:206 (+) Transcript_38646:217-834(+)
MTGKQNGGRTHDRTCHGVAGGKSKARTRARALEHVLKVTPRQILFSQDSGFATFSDGRWVASTMRDIVSGILDPASLPLLRVVRIQDGRLFTLDNRRLFIYQQCNIRSIDVEECKGEGADAELMLKRFGGSNGTTSQGVNLIIKPPLDIGKKGHDAMAALLPCTSCFASALTRMKDVRFVKGDKRAQLSSGCEECTKLVKFCKKC